MPLATLMVIRALKLLSLFLALTICVSTARAEKYVVSVTLGSDKLEGVEISGTDGISSLAGRYTDENGEWSFDTDELSSVTPTLAFSKLSQGLRFVPSEIIPSDNTCPGNICKVEAFRDGAPTAVITWSVLDRSGKPVEGVPVTVPGSDVPCAKISDADGYVVFAVPARNSACSDNDSDIANDFLHVVATQPEKKSCGFSTSLVSRFSACPRTQNSYGYLFADCADVDTTVPVGSSVSYGITVVDERGYGVNGVAFYGSEGVSSLPNRITGSSGRVTISTATLGKNPESRIVVIPTLAGMNFEPKILELSPNSCANNECRITAFPSANSQAVVRVQVMQGSDAMAGALVQSSGPAACGADTRRITDSQGFAYLPVNKRASCSNTDLTLLNDSINVSASLPRCNLTNATVCPTGTITDISLSATCRDDIIPQYTVSGRVFDLNGRPLGGAKIQNNNQDVATTDTSGRYSITVPEGNTPKLRPLSNPLTFDPSMQSLAELSAHRPELNFFAIAPRSSLSPRPKVCSVKSSYNIEGIVSDINGVRLANAQILNNHLEVARSGSDGKYQFVAPAWSDVWVTAEHNDKEFDPAGVAFPLTHCDQDQVNFRITETPGHILGGLVTDANGQIIIGAKIHATVAGNQYDLLTDHNGLYRVSAPDGAAYVLYPDYNSLLFFPEMRSGEATENKYDLNFSALAPTATPTATPTNTATPTVTRTPTNTATPTNTPTITATFTPSSTPTVTRTATATATPSITPTPSKTSTPTNTATATATITPTATNTIDPDPNKITICHCPPGHESEYVQGNYNSCLTITIGYNAWINGHSRNHDYDAIGSCSDRIPTRTPTATATATRTATKTNTPSPTATPQRALRLTSVCSENPSQQLRWKVTNPYSYNLGDVTWDIYGTTQRGTLGTVGAFNEVFFYTQRLPEVSNPNTARLFVGGLLVDTKASGKVECEKTPTPTATATATATHTASATPTATNTFTPSATPTETATPTATMTPTETPTATPSMTPEPMVRIGGKLTGFNGRRLTATEMARLRSLDISLNITRLSGSGAGDQYTIALSAPFEYEIALPISTYKISLSSKGRLDVRSRPKTFDRFVVNRDTKGFVFAVRPEVRKVNSDD